MFLFDCNGKGGRLWKIRGGRAHPLRYGFARRRPRSARNRSAGRPSVASRGR
jgi:hypothetical protein